MHIAAVSFQTEWKTHGEHLGCQNNTRAVGTLVQNNRSGLQDEILWLVPALDFFNIKKEISWDYNLDGKVCAVNEHMIEVVTCQTDRSVAIVSIS